MNKRDYEAMDKKELIGTIKDLEFDNDMLVDNISNAKDELSGLRATNSSLYREVEKLRGRIDVLDGKMESIGMSKSRNFTIDNLYYLLCDRYGVSHHTSKDKLKALVDEELSL